MATWDSWRALSPESMLVHRHRGVVLTAVGAHSRCTEPLQPAEVAVLAGRPPAQRADFTIGRRAAAVGLRALGVRGPVLRAPSGLPLFPLPVSGSLAHRAGVGICAATIDAQYAVGVDLELAGQLGPGHGRHLYAPGDAPWVHAGGLKEDRATVLFSAKEAVYKAWYAITGRPARFGEIVLAPRPGGFTCTTIAGHVPRRCAIHVRRLGRFVLSWVRLGV